MLLLILFCSHARTLQARKPANNPEFGQNILLESDHGRMAQPPDLLAIIHFSMMLVSPWNTCYIPIDFLIVSYSSLRRYHNNIFHVACPYHTPMLNTSYIPTIPYPVLSLSNLLHTHDIPLTLLLYTHYVLIIPLLYTHWIPIIYQ